MIATARLEERLKIVADGIPDDPSGLSPQQMARGPPPVDPSLGEGAARLRLDREREAAEAVGGGMPTREDRHGPPSQEEQLIDFTDSFRKVSPNPRR